MRRDIGLKCCLLLLIGSFAGTGCAQRDRLEPVVLGSPAMLFDSSPTAFSPTGFGRSPWPTTTGRLESVEQTVFVEYYRDYQGSATSERSNPNRHFRSYRTGTQLR